MEAFEYAAPKTTKEAIKLLDPEWGHTAILAGGTDLISGMKDGVMNPKRLVSLKHVKELREISYKPTSGLRVGAMATLQELIDHPAVKRDFPVLIQAAENVRSEQLRNMGTVGGELLQRPRCWYYRLGYGLLAQSGGKSLVPDGDNRYHAILGNSGPAYFVSPSMLAPILIALGSTVEIRGPQGARRLDVEKLFVTPTQPGQREHAVKPNEVLTEIVVPHHTMAKSAVYEVRQKQGLDWPLAAAAVVLHMNGGTVSGARVVLGHVAPVPWVSQDAAEALQGKSVSEGVAAAAGAASVKGAHPLSKNGYKVQLAKVAVKRAILAATKGEA
ncbi:MAG: FAD binding domain-containing protein [Terriglobia bacterium]